MFVRFVRFVVEKGLGPGRSLSSGRPAARLPGAGMSGENGPIRSNFDGSNYLARARLLRGSCSSSTRPSISSTGVT